MTATPLESLKMRAIFSCVEDRISDLARCIIAIELCKYMRD